MSFLGLPTELLTWVGNFLAEPELKSLARTNRHLHEIFDDILYQTAKSNGSVRGTGTKPFLRAGIFRAVRAGNYEAVCKFLRRGTDPNIRNPTTGKTPLHIAVEKGQLAIAEELLKHGADLTISENNLPDGRTALTTAAGYDLGPLLLGSTLRVMRTPRSTPMLELLLRYEPDRQAITYVFSVFPNLPAITARLLRKAAISHPERPEGIEFCNLLVSAAVDADLDDMLRWLDRDSDLGTYCHSFRVLVAGVITGNVAFVEALLKAGLDPNDNYRRTLGPLYFALYLGDLDMARCLLDHGAYLTHHGNEIQVPDLLPVCGAAASHRMEVLDFVLELEPDLGSIEGILHTAIEQPDSVAIIPARPIPRPPFNAEFLQRLIGLGDMVNTENEAGVTPLQVAARVSRREAVPILLQHGAVLNRHVAGVSQPLYVATNTDDIDLMDLLLQHGADPNFARRYSEDSHSSLPIRVARSGEAVNLLVKYGAGIEGTGISSEGKPLAVAASAGNVGVVTALLDAGASWDTPDDAGHLPIHAALVSDSYTDRTEMMKTFLDHGISVNEKSGAPCKGEPLCHTLSPWCRDLEAADFLLSRCANIHSLTPDGQDCLHDACIFRHYPSVHLLLHYQPDLSRKTGQGLTPLHLAVARNCPEIAALLLQHGAPVDEQSPCGKTALHVAIEKKSEPMLSLLLQHGASPHIGKHNSTSTLHTAIRRNETCITTTLLEHGVDVNAQNGRGMTPLMLAAVYGQGDVVSMLLDRGAELGHADRKGRTAIQLAHQQDRENTFRKLCEADPQRASSLGFSHVVGSGVPK